MKVEKVLLMGTTQHGISEESNQLDNEYVRNRTTKSQSLVKGERLVRSE